jgi:hypothetical protein
MTTEDVSKPIPVLGNQLVWRDSITNAQDNHKSLYSLCVWDKTPQGFEFWSDACDGFNQEEVATILNQALAEFDGTEAVAVTTMAEPELVPLAVPNE